MSIVERHWVFPSINANPDSHAAHFIIQERNLNDREALSSGMEKRGVRRDVHSRHFPRYL
jgi:hypothetical protein